MEFKLDLFMDVLWLGTLCGIISSLTIQKFKETKLINNRKIIALISILINIIEGFVIGKLFTNLTTNMCLCVGVITWVGAEAIYKKLKSKNLVKSLADLNIEENLDRK